MKIQYSALISYLDNNDLKILNAIRNFYHTFGYLIIKSSIQDNAIQLLKNKIFNLVRPHSSKDINNNIIINRNFIFHKILESNSDVLDWFLNESYLRIGKFLLGDNMALFNSDANIFLRGARFHRDHASLLPSLKILSYLQDSDDDNGSGDLFLIPGSHLVNDQFSSYLTANSSWPTGNSFQSNFNNIVDNSLIPANQRVFDGSQFPAHRIKINKNDLIFFDNRILHTTFDHFKPFVRLNFSVFFLSNPVDIPNSKLGKSPILYQNTNELDDFFNTMLNYEDCRYHSNLSIPKYFDILSNNLYFKKYGFSTEEAKIFPSADAQKESQLFHNRQFIDPTNLF